MRTKEFTEIAKWDVRLVDENGDRVHIEDTFANVEYKYFEGFNPPIKIIDNVKEDFKVSCDRVRRWFKLSYDEQSKLITCK